MANVAYTSPQKRRKRGALDDTPRYASITLNGGSGEAIRQTRGSRSNSKSSSTKMQERASQVTM